MPTRVLAGSLLLLATALAFPASAEDETRPSRPPSKGCAWEKAASEALGLEAWAQRCDFGARKVDFVFEKNSLALRDSDGGKTDPVVDIFDLQPDERVQPGIKRIFLDHSKPYLATRCILVPYRGEKPPVGVERYSMVPNRGYRKELSKRAGGDEAPGLPCGEYGDGPDGLRYFEAQPRTGVRRVLFVRVGKDEPVFDEKTLRLLAPR